MEKAEDRIRVLDVDAIAKDIYIKNTGIKADLKKIFGPDIIDDDGNILYGKLAKIVFSDQIELSKLNRLMFPLIRREIRNMVKSDKDNDYIIFLNSNNILVKVPSPLPNSRKGSSRGSLYSSYIKS